MRPLSTLVFPRRALFDRPTRECFCGGSSEPRCQSDRHRSRWSVPSRQETLRSRPSEATRARRARPPFWTARPPDRVAGASKTQICRTARRPRGARAASRARCAGRASDLFFVRPNAPGDDLPSPRRVTTRGRQGQEAVARPVPLELELAQAGGRRTRHAPRSHSPRTPIALALLTPPPSVACRCSSPGRARAKHARPPPRGRARPTGRQRAAAVCPRLAQALRSALAAPRVDVRSGLWPCLRPDTARTPPLCACTSQGGSARPPAVCASCAMRPCPNGPAAVVVFVACKWSVINSFLSLRRSLQAERARLRGSERRVASRQHARMSQLRRSLKPALKHRRAISAQLS